MGMKAKTLMFFCVVIMIYVSWSFVLILMGIVIVFTLIDLTKKNRNL